MSDGSVLAADLVKVVLSAIDGKIQSQVNKYVDNRFNNLRITGDQIVPNSIPGIVLKDGSINKMKVYEFTAEIVNIALATIQSAVIDTAQIENLTAYVANVVYASIESAEIDWANIINLTATIATIAIAKIDTARIKFAQIDGLIAGTALITEMVGDKVQIESLSVGNGNIVNLNANKIDAGTLSVERLIIVGSDKSIVYTINEANGTTQLSQTTIDGGSLTKRTITADTIVAETITSNELNATEIFANEAVIGKLIGGIGSFAELFAASAVMPYIVTNVVESDAFSLTVSNKIKDRVAVSATAPTTPILDTLWLDTSREPPLLKRWDGEGWEVVNDTAPIYERITQSESRLDMLDDQVALRVTKTEYNAAMANSAADVDTKADKVVVNELASQLTLTTDTILAQVTQTHAIASGAAGEVQTIGTYLKLDAQNGLTLTQPQAANGINLSNGAVAIIDGAGKQVAVMAQGQSVLPVLTVTGKLTMGKFVAVVLPDGGVIEQWVE